MKGQIDWFYQLIHDILVLLYLHLIFLFDLPYLNEKQLDFIKYDLILVKWKRRINWLIKFLRFSN